jgi:chaperonin GroES
MIQNFPKIRPLYDKVLVKRLLNEQTSKGGIIIPDSARERTQVGLVIAAGQGKKTTQGTYEEMNVQSGDTILFGKYSGTEIKFDKEEYLILKEDEILGIVEEGQDRL